MKYIKPLSIALAAIGLSTVAIANDAVFVPSQHSGFKVSVDTMYLRENSINKIVDSNYDFSNDFQLGYLFANTGNDLTVHYNTLSKNDSDSVIDNANGFFAKGTQASDLDVVDLEGGQRFCAGALDMRLFAGVRNIRLTHSLGLTTTSNENVDAESFSTKFSGFGPRLGTDVRYDLGCGFGLDAHLNTALLVGKINSKYEGKDNTINSSETNKVAQEVDGKLGFDCTHAFANKSALVFEIGYQTSNYSKVIGTSPINNANDINFNGAYLDVKYYS